MENKITVDEVVNRFDGGGFYEIHGDLVNGWTRNEQGEQVPNIHRHDIVRRINSVNKEKARLYCECGREFIINDNLILVKCNY